MQNHHTGQTKENDRTVSSELWSTASFGVLPLCVFCMLCCWPKLPRAGSTVGSFGRRVSLLAPLLKHQKMFTLAWRIKSKKWLDIRGILASLFFFAVVRPVCLPNRNHLQAYLEPRAWTVSVHVIVVLFSSLVSSPQKHRSWARYSKSTAIIECSWRARE